MAGINASVICLLWRFTEIVFQSLLEIRTLLRPRAWIYDIETVSPDWVEGASDDPVRRLHMPELIAEYERAGLAAIECVYRFRDRVVIRARKN